MFGPFKKEKPLTGLQGLGGGAGSGLVSGGDAWTPSGITATGGTIVTGVEMPDGTPYTYHFFPAGPHGPNSPNPNPFNVTSIDSGAPADVEYILVAGGGLGGGSWNPPGSHGGGGGGGAGGVVTNFKSPNAQASPTTHPFYPNSPGAITATVQDYTIETGRGAGGAPAPERMGTDSTAFGVNAEGGGNGSNSSPGMPVGSGGSGGGGGADGPSAAGSGNPTQGNPGGGGDGSQANSAGAGGGASQAGGPDGPRLGGNGINFPLPTAGFFGVPSGYGVQEPTSPAATDRWFAGGGAGGGPFSSPGSAIAGGFGGGGDSGDPDSQGQNAPTGSGSGGGGSGGGPDNSYYGHGGGGMVIIRYIKD